MSEFYFFKVKNKPYKIEPPFNDMYDKMIDLCLSEKPIEQILPTGPIIKSSIPLMPSLLDGTYQSPESTSPPQPPRLLRQTLGMGYNNFSFFNAVDPFYKFEDVKTKNENYSLFGGKKQKTIKKINKRTKKNKKIKKNKRIKKTKSVKYVKK